MRRLRFANWLWVALAASAAWGAGERPVVTLRADVTVATPDVSLGQVADVQGAEADMAAKLAAVSLSSAPLPGGSRAIAADYVRLRLRRFGLDPAQLYLVGETVTVHRAGPAQSPAAGTSATTPSLATVAPTEPPLVRRGQLVEAEVRCGGVAVRAAAHACSDARAGEMVELRLDPGACRIMGRVMGPGKTLTIIAGPATARLENTP